MTVNGSWRCVKGVRPRFESLNHHFGTISLSVLLSTATAFKYWGKLSCMEQSWDETSDFSYSSNDSLFEDPTPLLVGLNPEWDPVWDEMLKDEVDDDGEDGGTGDPGQAKPASACGEGEAIQGREKNAWKVWLQPPLGPNPSDHIKLFTGTWLTEEYVETYLANDNIGIKANIYDVGQRYLQLAGLF